jgi:hypothetical protein
MSNARLCSLLLSLLLSVSAQPGIARESLAEPGGVDAYGTRAIEPRFAVVEAPDGALEADAIVEHALAEVYYAMKPRDKVRVQWQGRQTYSTPVQTVQIAKVLKFELPKAWIDENAGDTVALTYRYQVGGTGEEQSSAPLALRIVGGRAEPVFQVLEALDGMLNTTLLGDAVNVEVLHEGMAVGDSVQVKWNGLVDRATSREPVIDRGTPVAFALPKAWAVENRGRSVLVSYTVTAADGSLRPAPGPIELQVTSASLENGRAVAARLDARYNDTRNDCSGKAAYYCNGVLIRAATADPAFHAWNPSPTAVTRDGVSFTYLRRDLGIARFNGGETQGFIVKDFETAQQAGQLALRLLCSFPSDGWTVGRSDRGCGAIKAYPDTSRYCSLQGIDTVQEWVRHYHQVPWQYRNGQQCAFAANAQAFALSLTARQYFQDPANERPYHNEVVIQTWPQGEGSRLPLEAVFYLSTQARVTGQAGARFIQQDFFDSTGRVLPVVRVRLGDGLASAFSFHPEDQAVAP